MVLTAALVIVSAVCLGPGVERAAAALFSQEAAGCNSDGTPLHQEIIEPEAMPDLITMTFDLGAARRLEIRTNLDSSRGAEIDSLATVVQRCYSFLESASGRQVPGNVLIYLLQYPQRPRYYRFEASVDDAANWNEVRVALLDTGQPLLGRGASRHVTEFIYDTLPHELTHSLLTAIPTVRHDLDGQAPQGTRWFIEGVCEKMAKEFAASEDPAFWNKALKTRRLERSLTRPQLCSLVWHWGQSSDFSWADESDLYGLSMLLVTAWSEYVELQELLQMMSQAGGDLDGADLNDLLWETTRSGPGQLQARAQDLGRALARLPDISLFQQQ